MHSLHCKRKFFNSNGGLLKHYGADEGTGTYKHYLMSLILKIVSCSIFRCGRTPPLHHIHPNSAVAETYVFKFKVTNQSLELYPMVMHTCRCCVVFISMPCAFKHVYMNYTCVCMCVCACVCVCVSQCYLGSVTQFLGANLSQ